MNSAVGTLVVVVAVIAPIVAISYWRDHRELPPRRGSDSRHPSRVGPAEITTVFGSTFSCPIVALYRNDDDYIGTHGVLTSVKADYFGFFDYGRGQMVLNNILHAFVMAADGQWRDISIEEGSEDTRRLLAKYEPATLADIDARDRQRRNTTCPECGGSGVIEGGLVQPQQNIGTSKYPIYTQNIYAPDRLCRNVGFYHR